MAFAEKQIKLLREAEDNCRTDAINYINKTLREPASYPPRCSVIWDNVLCWEDAPAGQLAKQHCPKYIHGFNPNEYAERYCDEHGNWLFYPRFNSSWTNFNACSKPLHDLTTHFESLRLLYTIGYGISLGSLIIAVCIMMCCSRLKSKSNTLHMNLFFAFMLRAALSFLKETLFVNGVGLEKDTKEVNGKLEFIEEGMFKFAPIDLMSLCLHVHFIFFFIMCLNVTASQVHVVIGFLLFTIHWECRLLIALFNYSICASQMWIFTEGLYLHMLIYKTLYTDRKGVKFYIYLGWLSPLLFFLPWVIVKAVNDNTYCWNIHTHAGYLWIMHGPLMFIVVVNFCFFLKILSVLCTRVRATQRHVGRTQYRRLAKFILVLIPLFGVMYIIFYVSFPTGFEMEVNMTQLYIEMTYNSFQGFILSLLFCFLNEEVHAELKRMWYRRQSRRSDSIVLTRSYVLSTWKKSSYQANKNFVCGDKGEKLTDSRIEKLKNDDIMNRLKGSAMHILKKETQVGNGGNVIPCNGNSVTEESFIDLGTYSPCTNKRISAESATPESV